MTTPKINSRSLDAAFAKLSDEQKKLVLDLMGTLGKAASDMKNHEEENLPKKGFISEALFVNTNEEECSSIESDDIANAIYDSGGVQQAAVNFIIHKIIEVTK